MKMVPAGFPGLRGRLPSAPTPVLDQKHDSQAVAFKISI